jgi:type III secretion protein D
MNAIAELHKPGESEQAQPDTTDASASAAPAQSEAASSSARCKLTVLNGVQQGAVAWLADDKRVQLGSSLDNDIVLREQSVAALHASIHFEDSVPIVTAIGASLIADGLQIDEGEALKLNQAGMIQLGKVGISIDSAAAQGHEAVFNNAVGQNQPQSSEGLASPPVYFSELQQKILNGGKQPDAALFGSQVDDLPAEISDDAAQPAATVKPHGKATGLKAASMTTAIMVIGALVVWQSGLFQRQPEQRVELQSALAASPFAALAVVQTDQGATINGYLHTKQEARQLDQWLDETGLVITNDVVVGEMLAERVHDVFRVHGVAADVQVNDGGQVVVATQVADTDLLASVDERVRADVPGITGLTIDNTPPAPANDIEAAPVVDPGKRVVSVAPDYIVTEDRSRYFVGSILPTGHRIDSIENGTVLLEKDGVTTTLEF